MEETGTPVSKKEEVDGIPIEDVDGFPLSGEANGSAKDSNTSLLKNSAAISALMGYNDDDDDDLDGAPCKYHSFACF